MSGGDENVIRFGELTPAGPVLIRALAVADVRRCAHLILDPDHYRDDGSCRCDDPEHASMRDWGYRWNPSAGVWE